MLDERIGEVKRVFARRNRCGYGAELMHALEEKAQEAGYERLVLECREGNGHAIEFYKKNGYVICGKYPPYEDEADAVCLEKWLGQSGPLV